FSANDEALNVGQSTILTIKIRDQYDNVIPEATVTIITNLGSLDDGMTNAAQLIITTDVNGEATLDVTSEIAGNATIQLYDGEDTEGGTLLGTEVVQFNP